MSFSECTSLVRSWVDYVLLPFTKREHGSADYLTAERKLSKNELDRLKQAFSSALKGAQNACANRTQLMEILHVEGLHENAAQRLHKTMKGDAAGVTFENLVIFMASVVKGPSEMAAHLTYELLVAAKSPEAQGEVLEQNLHALIAWVTGSEPGRDLSKALAQGAMRSTEGSGFRGPAEFMQWCKGFPAVSAAVVSLLDLQGRPAPSASAKAWPGQPGPQVMYHRPQLLFSSSATHTASLEDCLMYEGLIWLLSAWVPPDQAEVWELLFNGQVNGASFNTFMGKAAEKGPAMVLVRDKKGHLFGGYAAEGWSKHGQFYGSALSFIFSLAPAVARFRASGANDNMLWCGQGFSQLPNGIGWGGKAGYFGLYVDSTFELGMSRPCSTYNSQCLAADEVFDVDVVECWSLKQPEEEPQQSSKAGGSSVLDKFKEDRHLMNLAGRATQASAGVREARPEDEL